MTKKKICKPSGKVKCTTEEKANKLKMWIYSRDPSAVFGSLHVYLCPWCKSYHVGHIPKEK
jgi:hypothetical protein